MSDLKIGESRYINELGKLLLKFPEGISKNEIYRSKIATKITIDKYLKEMIEKKLVQVEPAPKKGLSNRYRLSEMGVRLFKRREFDPASLINVKIEIQNELFERLVEKPEFGKEEALRLKYRYEEAMKDPYESNEIATMLSNMMLAYVGSFLDNSRWTGNIMRDDRVMIVATLPKEIGKMLREMKEAGVMKNEVEAFNIIFELGRVAISNIYKNFKSGQPEKQQIIVNLTPYELTENGIKLRKIGNEELIKIAQKMKEESEKILSRLDTKAPP